MSVRRIGQRWQVRIRLGGGERVEQTLPRTAKRADALERWVESSAKRLKSWPRDLKYRVDVQKKAA